MCGIAFAARRIDPDGKVPEQYEELWTAAKESVRSRGPDAENEVRIVLRSEPGPSQPIELRFFASVLHMRGQALQEQPMVSGSSSTPRSIFAWNGEIFDGLEVGQDENDGQLVSKMLIEASSEVALEAIDLVEGPYAFVWYEARERKVHLARDPLGRRSLNVVENVDSNFEPFVLASSCLVDSEVSTHAHELPTESIWSLDLSPALTELRLSPQPRRVTIPRLNAVSPGPQDRITEAQIESPPPEVESICDAFIATLSDAVHRRVSPLPHPPTLTSDPTPSRVAILFSGGIDCATIAYLAHLHVPPSEPIDLLNVAFAQNPSPNASEAYDTPDRLTGKAALAELRAVAKGREWRFVEVDVTMEEYQRERAKIIQLTKPQDTVMDLSISAALYFAARGVGTYVNDTGTRVDYRSPARCLLSGLGADELLGGYSRHRAAFFSGATEDAPNWSALVSELQMDLDRLPTRNLGRDDRVISCHGKESRYPFLDRKVISSVARMPVWVKCDHALGPGSGDKLLLRLAARRMGLRDAATRVKRAIQFGAKSAKLDGTKKGTDQIDGSPSKLELKKRRKLPAISNLVKKLSPSLDDKAAGMDPAGIRLFTLNYPAGERCSMLGYPIHRDLAQVICGSVGPLPDQSSSIRVAPVVGKGLGVIAVRPIPQAGLVLAERPMIIMPEKINADDYDTLEALYLSVFQQMSPQDQRRLLELTTCETDGEPVMGKVNSNEIGLELEAHSSTTPSFPNGHTMAVGKGRMFPYTGVYPRTARHNHSCSPNARWHFDLSTFSLRLQALRDIRPTEEITVSYIEHLKSRSERTLYLSARWGFQCTCEACGPGEASLKDDEAKANEAARIRDSDKRRERLADETDFFRQLVEAVRAGEQVGEDLDGYVSRAQDVLSVISEEGLVEEADLILRAVALMFCREGRTVEAADAAMVALPLVNAVKGTGSELAREMLAISQGSSFEEVVTATARPA